MTAALQGFLGSSLSNAVAVTCLAAFVLAATWFCRRPAFRHALWLIVLLKFISPAWIELPLPELTGTATLGSAVHSPVAAGESSQVAPSASDVIEANAISIPLSHAQGSTADEASSAYESPLEPIESIAFDSGESRPTIRAIVRLLFPLALFAWGAGTALWFALVAVRLRQLKHLLRGAAAPSELLQFELQQTALRCGLRSSPVACLVDATITPFVCATWGRAVLVLPRKLIDQLDADERAALFTHELMHLRRRDHWVRRLELIVLGLYWWHPAAWLARRHLHSAGEECCDAAVVRLLPQKARSYAAALLKTVDYLADGQAVLPVAGTAFSQVNLLKRRFEMILNKNTSDRLPRAAAVCVLLAATVVLPLSLGTLWAGEAPPTEDNNPADAQPAQTTSTTFDTQATATGDVDNRLDRLEKLVATLAEELHAQQKKPNTGSEEKHKRHPELTVGGTYGTVVSRQKDEAAFISSIVDIHEEDVSFEALPDKEQKRIASLLRTVCRIEQLMQTNRNRHKAAVKNLKAVEEAYRNNTATLDLLLDAQRCEAVAKVDLATNALDLASVLSSDDHKILLALEKVNALTVARDRARDTWRGVKALRDEGQPGGEAKKETQAREQYFLFRGQLEVAMSDLTEAVKARDSKEQGNKATSAFNSRLNR